MSNERQNVEDALVEATGKPEIRPYVGLALCAFNVALREAMEDEKNGIERL